MRLGDLALAVGSFVAAPLAVSVSRRWGPRRAVTLGMSLEAGGILVTTFLISKDTSGLLLAAPLFVYGIGVGLATAQLTGIVLSEIPGSRSGLASGTNSTMHQVGSALGVAIPGTVLFATLVGQSRDNLAATLPNVPARCREPVATLVDESPGQILPALKNPSAASGAGFGGHGDAPAGPGGPLCRPRLRGIPAENGATDRGRVRFGGSLRGVHGTGVRVLGVVVSLLLPDTRHGSERVAVEATSTPGVAAAG